LFDEPGPPRPGVGVDVVGLGLRGGLAASDRESGAARREQRWLAPRSRGSQA